MSPIYGLWLWVCFGLVLSCFVFCFFFFFPAVDWWPVVVVVIVGVADGRGGCGWCCGGFFWVVGYIILL